MSFKHRFLNNSRVNFQISEDDIIVKVGYISCISYRSKGTVIVKYVELFIVRNFVKYLK
ncbi:hypothetical protein PGB90_004767 [Kerria lacca]